MANLWVQILQGDGAPREMVARAPVWIGRGEDCAVRLRQWRVARRHACLSVVDGRVAIEDAGSLLGTEVNGRRISECSALLAEDDILIGGARLRVALAPPSASPAPAKPSVADAGAPATAPPAAPMATPKPKADDPAAREAAPQPMGSAIEAEALRWRQRLQARLVEAMDLRRRDIAGMSDAALRAEADRLLESLVAEAAADLPPGIDTRSLRREVLDEAVGLGPLERLLADPTVSEIMVNRHDEVFIERAGRLMRHPAGFSSERSVQAILQRIVAPLGRRIDEASPMVDARLADGSRVNAVIAPIALRGASLTIRKFPARRLQLDDLLRAGAMDAAMASVLRCCVRERLNVVVSGGTGAGKTTLLNVLSGFIPPGERIVTIEDAAELRLQHEHLVSLEARPANLEGRGVVTIRDLVRNALRMRPDRIIVGECRGAEALDMLQAMNTGHEGSLTTLHANTPRDALARLETMILMAGMELPLAAVREQIASSIDVIVQQARDAGGVRRVTAIVEVVGLESGRFQLQEWFRYEPAHGGSFVGTGLLPSFLGEWQARGVELPAALFEGRTPAGEGR
ncbi:MAG: Flp pilus assembly complex ATPase component TadA [Pigmentiphaga sp.]|nr:Flp pilus assembly complex ATPase component TadA [Pigmentiphaga sp.]